MTDIAPKTTNNIKQLSARALLKVIGGSRSSTEIIRALKSEPGWIQAQETPLKKQLEQFIDQFTEHIEPDPIRLAVLRLEALEDQLRGDIGEALTALSLRNPRDVRDINQSYTAMLTNQHRGPHDIQHALDLLGTNACLYERFKALYPDPEPDDVAGDPDDSVPAVDGAGEPEVVNA